MKPELFNELLESIHEAGAVMVGKGRLDPVYGAYPIYEHCMPFDVSRAYDEASGIKHPRIWTAKRDREMWHSIG